MSNAPNQSLDAERLYENAKFSIQLGIEDFQLSQKDEKDGGNPIRALSSIRNLFAGMMLLFKFKLANSVTNPKDAYQLLYLPPRDFLPSPDGSGSIRWEPDGNFQRNKTIDVSEIKSRFEKFNINVNWSAITKLQNCRNHLEHLHPQNTLGELSGFVADLFPILTDFITNKLNESPKTFLGSAWDIMLKHKEFYNSKLTECAESWEDTGIPEGMREFLPKCSCIQCGSNLLKASPISLEAGHLVEHNEDEFEYLCVSCGASSLIAPRLFDAFDESFFYWPPDGEDATYEQCYSCDHHTYVINERICRWCDNELDYENCILCDAPLSQIDQDNDGLCSYCNYKMSKDD